MALSKGFEMLPTKCISKKASVKKSCAEALAKALKTDDAALQKLFFELCWHTAHGDVDTKQCFKFLEKASSKAGADRFQSCFVDALWTLDMYLSKKAAKNQRSVLFKIASDCYKKELVDEDVLQERLELEMLQGAGVIKRAKVATRKLLKANTKKLYAQKKFNLLREESEGYAKLLALFNERVASEHTIPSVTKSILSLIGRFCLDPNRVFDLLLSSYQRSLHLPCFQQLLKQFNMANLPHALGFKFAAAAAQNEKPDKELCLMTAILLCSGALDLNAIWPHLGPPDADLAAAQATILDKVLKEANRIGVVSLNQKADAKPKPPLTEKEKRLPDSMGKMSSKLGVLRALVRLGHWGMIDKMFTRFRLAEIFPHREPRVSEAVLGLLKDVIYPFYEEHVRDRIPQITDPVLHKRAPTRGKFGVSGAMEAVASADRMSSTLWSLLSHIDLPVIAADTKLVNRLVRLLKYLRDEHPDSIASGREQTAFERVLGYVVLPCLTLSGANVALAFEIWKLMQPMPYAKRYQCYHMWQHGTHNEHPALVAQSKRVLKATSMILKKLQSTKESVKQKGRELAKVSHPSPTDVMTFVVRHVSNFENFISPVVESLKYLNPLSFDVLGYVLTTKVCDSSKPRLKPDKRNLAMWITNLSRFCGALFKKRFGQIDMSGLLYSLANRLQMKQSIDLCFLKEILFKMAGKQTVEEPTQDFLEGGAGGPVLALQSDVFSKDIKVSNTAHKGLRVQLLDSTALAFPFLFLIASQHASIIYDTPGPHLQLISTLHAMCHEVFLNYTDFLKGCFPNRPVDYVTRCSLPPFSEMHSKFHFSPCEAFHVGRPAMRAAMAATLRGEELPTALKAWNPRGEEVKKAIRSHMSESDWGLFSADLYCYFWCLRQYDIYMPKAQYTKVRATLEKEYKDKKYHLNDRLKPSEEKKARRELKSLGDTLSKLNAERSAQQSHTKLMTKHLDSVKDKWLDSTKAATPTTMHMMLRACVIPRLKFSPTDAVYCAKFAKMLIDLETPFFSALSYYDNIIKLVVPCIMSSTEQEARHIGMFLKETWITLASWANSSKTYADECNKIGFAADFANPDKGKASYKDYKKLHNRWHRNLGSFFLPLLSNTDNFLQMRNALLTLNRIAEVFPGTQRMCDKFIAKLKIIVEGDVNEKGKKTYSSLGLQATQLMTQLTKRKPDLPEGEKKKGRRTKTAAATRKRKASPTKKKEPASTATTPTTKKPAAKSRPSLADTGKLSSHRPSSDSKAATSSGSAKKKSRPSLADMGKLSSHRPSSDSKAATSSGSAKKRSSSSSEVSGSDRAKRKAPASSSTAEPRRGDRESSKRRRSSEPSGSRKRSVSSASKRDKRSR